MENKENKENKKTEEKNFRPGNGALKLLPAAAVIAALAVSGVQGQTVESEKSVKASEGDLRDAEELEGLITTAYSYDFTDGTGDSEITDTASVQTKKKSKTAKKKTGGIKTGSTKALPQKTAASTGVGQGTTTTPRTSVPAGGYKDGTYQGSGTGFGGTITVQVTVSGGKIASVDILSAAGETGSYFSRAQGVVSSILSSQSPNVDAVSGATYSSNGIISAVQNALSQAANSSAATPTPTPKPSSKSKKNTQKTSYKDGTYTASAEGFNGDVTVTAVIKNGKITKLTSKNEDTPEFFNKAWKQIKSDVIASQSADVDTVSGATYSSGGIINAVKEILKEASASGSVTPTPVPETTVTPTPTAEPEPTDSPAQEETRLYKDGTYTGRAKGYQSWIKVSVTIENGKIADVSVTSQGESPAYYNRAWKKIQPAILEKQSTEGVDTVSGATYSSNGILNAVKQALEEASAAVSPTPEVTPTPAMTVTPTPEAAPTDVPDPTVTPTPEAIPSGAPEQTVTPTPEAAPTATPKPTATPSPTATPVLTEAPASGYKDGTYTGTGTGFNGQVTVTVTISGGQITGATYAGSDDEPEFSAAWNGIYNQIIGKQSADGIDTVTDATFSSKGLIEAFQNALSQAR